MRRWRFWRRGFRRDVRRRGGVGEVRMCSSNVKSVANARYLHCFHFSISIISSVKNQSILTYAACCIYPITLNTTNTDAVPT